MNANPQLIEFIQKSREFSKTDEEIKQSLLQVGWSEELIEEAFSELPKEEIQESQELVEDAKNEEEKEELVESREEVVEESKDEETSPTTELNYSELTESQQEQPLELTDTSKVEATEVESDQIASTEIEPLEKEASELASSIVEPESIKEQIPTKKSSKKIIFFIIFIFLIILGGVATYIIKPDLLNFFVAQTKLISPVKEMQPTEQSEEQVNINSNILAYTTTNEETEKMNVFFYDTEKKQQLAEDETLKTDDNNAYELGTWSPTGQYLPILGIKTKTGTRDSTVTIYFFDSSQNKAKKAYSYQLSGTSKEILKSLQFSTKASWVDNNKLKIKDDLPIKIGSRLITFLTTDGKIQTSEQPKNINVKFNKLSYQVDPATNVISGPIKYDNTDVNVNLNNNNEIIGTTENSLLVLDKSIPDKTSLKIFPFSGSTSPTEINLTDKFWITQNIIIDPSNKFLVAYQIDNEIKPTQERYLQIDLLDASKNKLIFEQDISTVFTPSKTPSLLKNKTSFYLTNNGNWIIGERRYSSVITSGNDFYMKNISTGEEVTICSAECTQMSAYYQPRIINVF